MPMGVVEIDVDEAGAPPVRGFGDGPHQSCLSGPARHSSTGRHRIDADASVSARAPATLAWDDEQKRHSTEPAACDA
jgi:hypothetical protein